MFSCLVLAAVVSAPPSMLTVNVRDSLEASVVRALPEGGLILSAQVARLLRWRGDLNRHVHRGDELTVLYEAGPEPVLVAMRFRGAQLALRAYRFTDADGIERYYDEGGALIEPRMVNPPVPTYVQITETVQWGRGKRRHRGIDLKAPEGAPIRLPFAGRVVRRNWATRVNGNCIEIAFDSGRIGRFLHLSHVDPRVRPGVHLPAGTPLGAVGSTGHSNAPHLHYEILSADGKPLEPLLVHGNHPARLPSDRVVTFNDGRNGLDRLMGSGSVLDVALSDTCVIDADANAEESLSCQP